MSFKIKTEKEVVTKELVEVEATLNEFIGYKVKEKRELLDLNIAQVSRRLFSQEGVSLSGTTIGKIERGYDGIRIDNLHVICKVLGMNLIDVFPSEMKDIEITSSETVGLFSAQE